MRLDVNQQTAVFVGGFRNPQQFLHSSLRHFVAYAAMLVRTRRASLRQFHYIRQPRHDVNFGRERAMHRALLGDLEPGKGSDAWLDYWFE